MLQNFDFATPALTKFSNFVDGKGAEHTYELINELTQQSDDGFFQMVKFYAKNNKSVSTYIDVDGEGRELHCELTLQTKGLVNDQDVTFGVLYSKIDTEGENYDGLKISFNYSHVNLENTVFQLEDVYTTKYPDVWQYGLDSEIITDNNQNWTIEHSEAFCSQIGDCNFKV